MEKVRQTDRQRGEMRERKRRITGEGVSRGRTEGEKKTR